MNYVDRKRNVSGTGALKNETRNTLSRYHSEKTKGTTGKRKRWKMREPYTLTLACDRLAWPAVTLLRFASASARHSDPHHSGSTPTTATSTSSLYFRSSRQCSATFDAIGEPQGRTPARGNDVYDFLFVAHMEFIINKYIQKSYSYLYGRNNCNQFVVYRAYFLNGACFEQQGLLGGETKDREGWKNQVFYLKNYIYHVAFLFLSPFSVCTSFFNS